MAKHLHAFFVAAPLAAVALALVLGYLCGKIRLGTFLLSPVAGTLIVAIAMGQLALANVLLTLAGPVVVLVTK